MKKLFLAGGKFADIPAILAARKLGFYVITSGNNKDDLGHAYANETILEDYSNKEAMLELIERLKIDVLIPACDDYSLLTCSYVNDYLKIGNFDSFETSKIIHHKNLWREFCAKNNIISPKALSFSKELDAIESIKKNFREKIIIKPIDSASGKGVSTAFANDILLKDNINFALEHSRSKKIVVEEFIEGSRHGFSTILINQKVIFYFYDNEQYNYKPFAVSGTTTSSIITQDIAFALIDEIEKIASILKLEDGIFHTQTILKTMKDGSKKLVIIEACRRAGGDLYPKFVSFSTGIDYPLLYISSIANLPITKLKLKRKKFLARQCIISTKAGVLSDIIFDCKIKIIS
ncbi:acetyl-CoA carboxylase biotin carboxylase subunit family protein [Helicobacter sp. MIT 14-3879]|uniref:ATP-grasp domain-containing protein n=1 Tax=Helicobacter sp. MIT 14-3879 TaxID=2040649 RepID=UPI0015F1648A|nr:phosphoribosylglycinamide synthetase [Helicobacter sp. MIT 14-3879]